MKIEIKELAKFLAENKIEYPFSSDWPENKHDAAIVWEGLLTYYFSKKVKKKC